MNVTCYFYYAKNPSISTFDLFPTKTGDEAQTQSPAPNLYALTSSVKKALFFFSFLGSYIFQLSFVEKVILVQ